MLARCSPVITVERTVVLAVGTTTVVSQDIYGLCVVYPWVFFVHLLIGNYIRALQDLAGLHAIPANLLSAFQWYSFSVLYHVRTYFALFLFGYVQSTCLCFYFVQPIRFDDNDFHLTLLRTTFTMGNFHLSFSVVDMTSCP